MQKRKTPEWTWSLLHTEGVQMAPFHSSTSTFAEYLLYARHWVLCQGHKACCVSSLSQRLGQYYPTWKPTVPHGYRALKMCSLKHSIRFQRLSSTKECKISQEWLLYRSHVTMTTHGTYWVRLWEPASLRQSDKQHWDCKEVCAGARGGDSLVTSRAGSDVTCLLFTRQR